ncbi:PREDICTED: MATH domain and coiled-coil domain-containing protein At2g42470-like [Camelina sativa]|uniref:MATH domain and coiled-coil domain-containing protein At2g42470-like n=1 Tax=Camelina sativa TaxID=90675 RepID=A0ABM0XIF9_CAMSA|nr:PREDICTED: MATH domain and coiled-coil domain-containing protein At2g42470-like [Camelina sativa]
MVEDQKETTSFTFEIDNFWEKEADVIRSPIFSSGGGCEWYVDVYPKGYGAVKDHLSVHFGVATPESLRLGWKRRANTSLVLLNQSGKELYRSPKYCYFFCAQLLKWGYSRVSTHKKLKEEGLLENNNKLIVQVEIKVVEEGDITGNEMLDVRGFQVLYSQVTSATHLLQDHPDIAVNFIPKIPLVKTAYMSALLGLVETLNKPPESFTETELNKAKRELNELTRAGFKLDWLGTKLDELSFDDKDQKANADDGDSLVEELFKVVVHSWNDWKVRVGFSHLLHSEKID